MMIRRFIANNYKCMVKLVLVAVYCCISGYVYAGGGSENLLLIIDPTDPDSMYVGNYYKSVRNIPDSNILYIDPTAANYLSFLDTGQNALFGTLANRQLADHIDYVALAPVDSFYVSASGYISDGCATVNRFALPSVYTMAFISDDILGGLNSSEGNEYFGYNDDAIAFDSSQSWVNGQIDNNSPAAKQYFIGMQLGYTGDLGNTVSEIIQMIDRSVGVDGTHPTGTFYFMETNDSARSGPRHDKFDAVVNSIIALGGQAEHRCCAALPSGMHDCAGIMTGAASPDIDGTDMTLLPGAFCDHLTSYAGTFDTSSQVKMSRWIAKGAGGSHGTVQEPCNYAGKFPHPRIHLYYYSGLSLGEATLRSLSYVPFQGMLLGDPLTRPWTYIPVVTVDDIPSGPVAGIITLTPQATTTHPTANIDYFELLIDGISKAEVKPNKVFHVDTERLNDGFHDVRILAYDDTLQKSTGSFAGILEVNNNGKWATVSSIQNTGDLATGFDITVDAFGGSVTELRIVHNGRVVATTDIPGSQITVYGATFGAGNVDIYTEAIYTDGSKVRSNVISLDIANDPGLPVLSNPLAFSYSQHVLNTDPFVVELPATFDDSSSVLTYTLLTSPAQATVMGNGTGPYRIMVPDSGATGTDQFTFQVDSGTGQSEIATVDIIYSNCHYGQLVLDVSPLRKGQVGTFTVTCAYPDERTYLAYSLKGEGETYVQMLNITLGLAKPSQVGSMVVSDSQGTAIWELDIPNIKTPRLVWFQAAQKSVVSNVVLAQINK